jgi:hypothetical protein
VTQLQQHVAIMESSQMFKKSIRGILFGGMLLAGVSAHAASSDSYGELLAGSFTPSSSFATLSFSNVGNVYTFTLTANGLNTLFTDGAFIGAIAVDSSVNTVVSNVSGDSPVSVAPGGGPGGIFDYRFDLTKGKDRLTDGESVTWTATFASAVNLSSTAFALHVQGLTKAQGDSAWYTYTPPTVSAVPEAETYAMMALGLGMMGFVARRRRSI